jgi:hypothetical protein
MVKTCVLSLRSLWNAIFPLVPGKAGWAEAGPARVRTPLIKTRTMNGVAGLGRRMGGMRLYVSAVREDI